MKKIFVLSFLVVFFIFSKNTSVLASNDINKAYNGQLKASNAKDINKVHTGKPKVSKIYDEQLKVSNTNGINKTYNRQLKSIKSTDVNKTNDINEIYDEQLKASKTNDINEIYDEQLKASKANNIVESLPNETAEHLKDIGVNSVKWEDLINIKYEDILQKIFDIAKQKTPKVFKSLSFTLAAILLNALFSSFENSFNKNSLGGVMNVVSNLCISMSLIKPICKIIENATFIISNVSKLLLCYIPVMGGIMVASGQNISAFSYSSIMLLLGNLSSHLANNLLIPFLNCFLALSFSTSLSTKLNLKSLNSWFLKSIKWILSFIVSIFVGVLTIKNVIGNTLDNFNNKTIKFLLSGCIPVIGSSLGDAYATVHGCVKILKSGVGAFFILAVAFIFLPIILECTIWIISVNLCTSVGEIFGLSKITSILKSVTDVLKILLAIIICLMIVLVISTVIVLLLGSST